MFLSFRAVNEQGTYSDTRQISCVQYPKSLSLSKSYVGDYSELLQSSTP
jgi:hypothetical protein